MLQLTILIIIHQTHYEGSDWSGAFNQFTVACELDIDDKCNICCKLTNAKGRD